MNEKMWAELGLTDTVLTELYKRGNEYVATRIPSQHREDAIQYGMSRILHVVTHPPDNLPSDPEELLKYLTKTLYRQSVQFLSREIPPDTNIPID